MNQMKHSIVEYLWVGGKGELRSKARVLRKNIHITKLFEIPNWNFDGSSTGQADTKDSEIELRPVRLFKCPFRRDSIYNYIVLCDTYKPDGTPALNNYRAAALEIFNKYLDQKPWYGLEQEYFICEPVTGLPVGFELFKQQGQYYCSVGAVNAFCREIIEEHMEACLYAGITIAGINAEVAVSQYEFQVGPVEGIDAADQLWVSRYILERVAEKYGKVINYHPKPIKEINGSGCHTNFSTKDMRSPGVFDGTTTVEGTQGIHFINDAIKKLGENHAAIMEVTGENNRERMTGQHETAHFDIFTSGVGNRNASIRVPIETAKMQFGYLEHRCAAANVDPYRITSIILETIMTNDFIAD